VWDAKTGQERRVLRGHAGEITGCAFSPDGQTILSGSSDQTLRLWDSTTGRQRAVLTHAASVESCAFSPDGTTCVAACADRTLVLWDAQTGGRRAILLGHTNRVTWCGFRPDGAVLASAGRDRSVRLWDVGAAGAQETSAERHTNMIYDCAFSPRGDEVVSASLDGTLKIWETGTSRLRRTLGEPSDNAGAWNLTCAWSADGTTIAAGLENSTLRVWDAHTGQERATLFGHTNRVWACAISPDSSTLASVSHDGTLRLWNLRTRQAHATPAGELPGGMKGSEGCAFSPDGRYIAALTDDVVFIWDPASGDRVAQLTSEDQRMSACAFSPDGALLAIASNDGTIGLWATDTWQEERHFSALIEGGTGRLSRLAFSPDGQLILGAEGSGWMVNLFEVRTGVSRGSLRLSGAPLCLAAHPAAPLIAIGEAGAALDMAELVGITYGPLIVTAHERVAVLALRCPACGTWSELTRRQLGAIITCAHTGCPATLRVNPFVITPAYSRDEPPRASPMDPPARANGKASRRGWWPFGRHR
jgi:WD40 repeat protein